MVDTRLIVAECRAAELLTVLQDAVNGGFDWRRRATELLRAIGDHELPARTIDALREADTRKRAAELLDDLDREIEELGAPCRG